MKSPSFIHALNLNILRNKILNKIMSIPQKKKKEPDLLLIGPLLKDAEYYSDSEIIRELYANLVAASANKDYDGKVHLVFSSIIKQISPHDAALLIRLPHQGPLASYFMMPGFEVLYEDVYLEDENDEYNFANTLSIQNFERLGFLELGRRVQLCGKDLYKRFEKNKIYQDAENRAKEIYGDSGSVVLQSGYFIFTKFGQVFREVCNPSVKLTN